YRFAPGEAHDGATLKVPLLALPTLTRATVDAALPSLAAPRVEALLRSLPKDARRSLIPIGATVVSFMDVMGAPSTGIQRLADWLKEARGVPSSLIRFDLDAVPAHLTAQLAVVETAAEAAQSHKSAPSKEPDLRKAPELGRELARGGDLGLLRRRCAARARAELDRCARDAHPKPWGRFELDDLGETAAIDLGSG